MPYALGDERQTEEHERQEERADRRIAARGEAAAALVAGAGVAVAAGARATLAVAAAGVTEVDVAAVAAVGAVAAQVVAAVLGQRHVLVRLGLAHVLRRRVRHVGGRRIARHEVDERLELIVGRAALGRVAEPGHRLLDDAEVFLVRSRHAGRAGRALERELELESGVGRDGAGDVRRSIRRQPVGADEAARAIARLGGAELRVRVPRLGAHVAQDDVGGDALPALDRHRRRRQRPRLAHELRRVGRGVAPLAEVVGLRGVEIAAVAVTACGDAVLRLAQLRARIPLSARPRVGLPAPGNLAGVEEPLDDVVAAVGAGAAPAEHRGDAVHVGVDRRLLRFGRVEVDAEVDRTRRRHAGGDRLRLRDLGVGDALRVAAERVVGGVLVVGDDVDAVGDERLGFGGGQDLSVRRRVVDAEVARGEGVALAVQRRHRGAREGVIETLARSDRGSGLVGAVVDVAAGAARDEEREAER